jgi:hypothetical protein
VEEPTRIVSPGGAEVFDRQKAEGNGAVAEDGRKMIAAVVAVGKCESREVCVISKRSGKPAFDFPRRGFSAARSIAASLSVRPDPFPVPIRDALSRFDFSKTVLALRPFVSP